jgi:hypothetical protein
MARTEPLRNSRLDGLLQEIRQTTFPIALELGDLFKQQGYKPYFNHHYLDGAERRDRAIDLLSTRGHLIGAADSPIHLIDAFYAEVKKSESPWIIFTSDRTESDHEAPDPFACDGLTPGFVTALNNFAQTQLLASHARIGRYCCGVDGEGQLSLARAGVAGVSVEPFDAMLACAKASINLKLTRPRTAWANTGTMWSVTKLVLFDGPLYEAFRRGQSVDIVEENHIPFILNLSSTDGTLLAFVVHIVRHAHFPAFLREHQTWIGQLSDAVKRLTGD